MTPAPPEPRPRGFVLFTLGGGFLSGSAGYVNAVAVLAGFGISGTHLTGTITWLTSEGMGAPGPVTPGLLLAVVASFVLGSALSGASLTSTQLAPGRRYGVLLMAEAAMLGGAGLGLSHGQHTGLLLVAAASGLQNGLGTHYSRAVVRTTHLTGTMTDLGLALGKWVSRRGVTGWRVVLYLTLAVGFVVGAALGAVAARAWGAHALYVPAGGLGITGACYARWRTHRMRAEAAAAL